MTFFKKISDFLNDPIAMIKFSAFGVLINLCFALAIYLSGVEVFRAVLFLANALCFLVSIICNCIVIRIRNKE